MNLDDIIQIIVTSVLNGDASNPILNVFWYRQTSEPDPVQGFTQANVEALDVDFRATVIAPVKVLSCQAIEFKSALYTNWSKPTRPFVLVNYSGEAGLASGDWLPATNSWGFRYNRSNNTTRNGYKRFSGVPEAYTANGAAAPAQAAAYAAAAVGLQDAIMFTAGMDTISFVPTIVRKNAAGNAVDAHQDSQSVSFYGLTTQNTRKR